MARTRASDFEDKQKAILESAAAVFAEMGMDKASMALVAQHSKVSKALLYHYYPSKDALIFDIIRSHLAEVATAVEAADDASLAPKDRLKALVLAVLKTYEGADNHHKVQLNATSALTDEQKAEIRSYERQIVKRFSAVLREINPKLDSKERPLLMPVTMSLFGMMNWVYLWFRDDGPITREDYAQIATTLMLAGIMEVR
jgi:AcrR family transcriptional regulator